MIEKKVMLLIPSLKLGGAERNLVWLGENLKKNGYDVTIWHYNSDKNEIFTELKVKSIYAEKKIWKGFNFIVRIFFLTRKIKSEKPSVIISFLESVSLPSLVASIFSNRHKDHIVSVRGNPKQFNWYYNLLVKVLYPRARFVVIPSKEASYYMKRRFGLNNVISIPNAKPSFPEDTASLMIEEKRAGPVVVIGRCIKTKRFDLAVEIMHDLSDENKRELIFIGDGPLKKDIEEMGFRKNVAINWISNVDQKKVIEYLKKSSVLISCSETECWPNVIIEALSTGTPVLAADIEYGPAEIIKNGKNGFLFELRDISTASLKLDALLSDACLYETLYNESLKSVTKYESNIVIDQWVSVIEKNEILN